MTKAVVPYHRRETETAVAWAAFVLYRNLGPNRTLTSVGEQLNKSVQLLSRWATKYEWKRRALAYDRENEDAKRKAELAAIEDMRKRHIEGALLMQDISKIELKKIKKHATDNKDTLALEPKEVREFYKEGAAQERLNRGEPGEIVRTVDELPISIRGLPIEELRVLRGVHVRLKQTKDSGKELPEHDNDDDFDGDNETEPIDL